MKQFEGYEEYLKQSELSKQTRQVYLREAEKFVRYLNGKGITKDRTMLYREKLREEDLSPATINLYVIAVNRYLRYLECGQASIKTLKVQKKCSVENVISRKEYQELLNYAKRSGREKYYYIMRTLALTGIRVSELQYITVETLETGRVQVYNKGKIRDVYLPDVLIRELKKFCREEKENDGIIFRGRGGDPINRSTVYKMIAYLGDMVGIKKEKVHPHSFRHFFAISYIERYGNLAELADLLGHTSIETTRIYTTSTVEEKRRKLNNLGL